MADAIVYSSLFGYLYLKEIFSKSAIRFEELHSYVSIVFSLFHTLQ